LKLNWLRFEAALLVFCLLMGVRGRAPVFASSIPTVQIEPGSGTEAGTFGGPEVRLKDIGRILGDRSNQLVGLGLVVGLDGTGDGRGTKANTLMVANMLRNLGIEINDDELRLRNTAAVMVTAELPCVAYPGDRLDVTVSSFGDAKSLQGGFLIQTPLQAADGRIYAVAQGAISIGGYEIATGGSRAQKNIPTVGRIPAGCIVEKTLMGSLVDDGFVRIILDKPDFGTAAQVAQEINVSFPGIAEPLDNRTIKVRVPDEMTENPVEFISTLEQVRIRPDVVARVVINERTGTVIMGGNVRIAKVAVAHGNLLVDIRQQTTVSQPLPASAGETVVVEEEEIEVSEESGALKIIPATASVNDLVAALNAIGATPRDLIAILQAIDKAGALYGKLDII